MSSFLISKHTNALLNSQFLQTPVHSAWSLACKHTAHKSEPVYILALACVQVGDKKHCAPVDSRAGQCDDWGSHCKAEGCSIHPLEQRALHYDCCCGSVRTHLAADCGCKCHCRSAASEWKVQQLWSSRHTHVDVEVFDTAQQSHKPMAQVNELWLG